MTTPLAPPKPPDPAPNPNPNPNPPPSPISGAPAPAPDPLANLKPEDRDRLLTFYMGAARAQESRLNQLAGELETLKTKPAAPATPDMGALNKGFYEKPFETTQEIVRREISEAIAPLKEFASAFSANSELDRIKNEFRGDPRIAQVFALGEVHIDELVNRAVRGGAKLTRELVMGAVANVKGGLDMGWIQVGAGAPIPAALPAPGGGPSPLSPPHLRPSAPPAPGPGDTKPKLRDLTEEESRLARENKMTQEEYLRALNMSAGAVTDPNAWKAPA